MPYNLDLLTQIPLHTLNGSVFIHMWDYGVNLTGWFWSDTQCSLLELTGTLHLLPEGNVLLVGSIWIPATGLTSQNGDAVRKPGLGDTTRNWTKPILGRQHTIKCKWNNETWSEYKYKTCSRGKI